VSVAEITYLTWTEDGLLRHTVCLFGLVPASPREMSGGKRRAEASELSAAETLNSAATPWQTAKRRSKIGRFVL
jgi:hypothetical protein